MTTASIRFDQDLVENQQLWKIPYWEGKSLEEGITKINLIRLITSMIIAISTPSVKPESVSKCI